MSDPRAIQKVTLGEQISLEQVIAAARYGAEVVFSETYAARVNRSRALVERWVAEGKAIYGTTTGFGNLVTETISEADAEKLQLNLIRGDATSVGKPLKEEEVRAIMLVILQNCGQGYSGIRLEVLELLRQLLNLGVTPRTPGGGSVGYLSVSSHIVLVMIGEGQAYYKGELLSGAEALAAAGLSPVTLSYKEGLALTDNTAEATGLGAIALYDLDKAMRSADVIAALSIEVLKGQLAHFDERVSAVRPHAAQQAVAENVRRILADSGVIKEAAGKNLQDALSMRSVPQLHGAAKKLIRDAKETFDIELNACTDNPILWPEEGAETAISACNPDASFTGMAIDACCIGATSTAKMSERRNNRMIDGNLSGYSWFLVKNPGLNCGLMVPQYTQAGLINEMRVLSHPATIDNVPTCGNQEDVVSMGYNACKKGIKVAEKLEYVLAIELFSSFEAQPFMGTDAARSSVSQALYKEIGEHVPVIENDFYFTPSMEYLRDLIHSGDLLAITERVIGEVKA